MNDEVELQRKYYTDTAAKYDDMHMEGDGVYYSYSFFNGVRTIRSKFPSRHFMSAKLSGHNLYKTTPHLALFAETK